MKKLTLALSVLITVLLLTFTVSAEIKVTKGVVTGLDPNTVYDYGQITLANYTIVEYKRLDKGVTKIEGLEPGLWCILNSSTFEKTVVWVEGDPDDRTDIGDVYYSSTHKKDVVRVANVTNFLAGSWTGNGAFNHSTFATYYISDVGGHHLTATDAQNLEAGTLTRTKLRDKLQKISYKYAYAPHEILPVEELYTFSFNVGVRQGSINIEYSDSATDPNPKTKYVLYTMNDKGEVTAHSATVNTIYQISVCKTNHVISIKEAFPDATGWIVGIEVFPYGDVPTMGLKFVQTGTKYVNTIFFVEYVPGGYATKYKSGTVAMPFQYNGANTAYVDGYADGKFHPDGDITKAETAAIIAKAFVGSSDIPIMSETDFADCTPNDWYYNAISYIDYIQGFEHVESNRIAPNKPITRGELAQILYNVLHPDKSNTTSFVDISESDSSYTAICSLEKAGIIGGYEDNTFRPYSTVTRAETVALINRLTNLVANKKTVVKSTLDKTFTDIEGHWAEYDILIAANDKVKSVNYINSDGSALLDTGSSIEIENDHFLFRINKTNGKVTEIINKYDNTNILATSSAPWFAHITTNTGLTFTPNQVDVVDGRLHIKFLNGTEAYFIVESKPDYITVELDSEIPLGVSKISFGQLAVNTPFSDEDEESYRLSGVMMNYNTNSSNFPGGNAKTTNAIVMNKFDGMGGKLAIAFSKFGGKVEGKHRAILKQIVADMDPEIATVSQKGGAYTSDHTDVYGDYVILSNGFEQSTALETAQVMKKYSIDQLDMHQGGSTFIQGEFNFKCALTDEEKKKDVFGTAAMFKERVGDIAINEGIQLGLHTYSSLVPSNATTITANPKWQKQIEYDRDNVLTLANDVNASVRVFYTNEDASGLTLASGNIPWSGPATRFYLIDEEIVLCSSFGEKGLNTVTRGQCGTKAAPHKAGAEIRQLQCWYGMFQSIPGSDLFYHIADLTAQAYNDGGFEMIYLDGLESFGHFVSGNDAWYYYASFIHRVVSGCKNDPVIEGSAFPLGFWTARARGGAWDHAHRDYKGFNTSHLNSNKGLLNYYCTATLGWFHYSPDMSDPYKNTSVKTVFRDDLDHMGSIGIAYDMTTVCQPFSVANFKNYKTLADNTLYYSLYSRLRKGGYFSPAVKKALRLGISAGKEYKLEEQRDGSWAFREMTYFKNKVLDMVDSTFITGNGNNPYNAQKPYVRIEQRYSTDGTNEQIICEFDETAQITAHSPTVIGKGTDSRHGYMIKVYGNNSATDAIMLTLNGNLNFCIPLNFSGWREFILADADNADHKGYTFSGENKYQRGTHTYTISSVSVILCGSCTGVMLDDLRAVPLINTPAINPSVTVGTTKLTFNTTLRSGEYVEYFPELNKAYHHSYHTADEETKGVSNTNGNNKTVTEITFTGSVTIPKGNFKYTYGGTSENGNTLRAQVVIGAKSTDLIKNEASWNAPEIELEDELQWVTLK